ncbi:MAG: response regulator [Nitrospirae bacterium]|nr:response regulator [Nitrospirota bacterium]
MSPKKSKKVLVVDKNADTRAVLSAVLNDNGYDVAMASSGEEALKIAKETAPDVVLLDGWLSDMDAIQVMIQLKEIRSGVPVIFISDHSYAEYVLETAKAGAFAFLDKPLSQEKLLLTVIKAVESAAKNL